jgi:hypothetical protein
MRREKRKPMAMDIAQKSACSSSHAIGSDGFTRQCPPRSGRLPSPPATSSTYWPRHRPAPPAVHSRAGAATAPPGASPPCLAGTASLPKPELPHPSGVASRPEPSRLARRPPYVARLPEPQAGRERLHTGNGRVRKRRKEEEIKKGKKREK